jgi:hypothetical protein
LNKGRLRERLGFWIPAFRRSDDPLLWDTASGGYNGAAHRRSRKYIGNAKAWRDTFEDQMPEIEIRIWPDAGELADIEYLAFMRPNFDILPPFPNLKAMFSRSAGVEALIHHPKAEGPARQGRTTGR